MSSEFFTITQYAQESTRGTAVAAAKIWPGQMPKIISDSKVSFPAEQFNIRMESRRAHVDELLYLNTLSDPNAGFQQLILPLQCGLKGLSAPAEVTGGQGDYTWDFNPNLTPAAGANAPKAATLEMGDDAQAYRVEYCMFDKITIKGDIAQDGGASPVGIDASYFGRRIQTNTFTSSLSLANKTPMNAKLARLYMDTAWAGVGGTELANLLRNFQLEIMTGLHPKFSGSANQYFNSHEESYIGLTATFTLEGGSTAAALLAAQQGPTFKVFRLDINGPQIGTGINHQARFDFGGYAETLGYNEQSDRGDNLSTLVVKSVYDTTGAKGFKVSLSTNQNAV